MAGALMITRRELRWTDDLRQLMRDVPLFDTMFRELRAL